MDKRVMTGPTVSRKALRACAGVNPMSESIDTCSADGSGALLPLVTWIGASMSVGLVSTEPHSKS